MRTVLTIAWKDLKLMLTSPMFYLIAGLCSVIWSFNFLRALQEFARLSAMAGMPQFGGAQQLNLHYNVFVSHISFVNIIFIFAIPALTMRLLAEEKKMRTYDLLLTAPVSATQIAAGKFLAGYGTALALVLISFIYPLGSMLFADFHFGPVLTSYLGLALVTGAYVATGLFASSMTESVVLSVVMGVLFNLMLWFVSQGAGFSDGPVFSAIMDHINIGQQFFSFLKGTVQISALAFFLSCVGLFIFLSQRVIESSRWR